MARDYKDYVGPAHRWESAARERFHQLLTEGMREDSRVLDVGCGSLRLGRLLIPFLAPRGYCGLEPGREWLEAGLEHEVVASWGEALLHHKQPRFDHNGDFDLGVFQSKFDLIVAFAVFIHCGPGQLRTFLQNAHGTLAPGGRMLVDVNLDDRTYQEGRHRKYAHASHQKIRYAEQDLLDLLIETGWSPVELDRRADPKKGKSRTLYRLTPARGASGGA